MTLRLFYQYVSTELADVLTGDWEVASLSTSSASDYLVELVYLDSVYEYQELVEFYCTGRLAFVFYKKFDDNLSSQLDAVETTLLWLRTLNLDDVFVSDGDSIARVETSVAEGSIPYKVMTITVPFEFIVRDIVEDED